MTMNILDMIPVKRRGVLIEGRKIRVNRDQYREFTDNVSYLTDLGHELPHMVEHEKEGDMFTVELLGEIDLEGLDKLIDEGIKSGLIKGR
jgi:hypothetical protein|tara:strand:+ start:165 stop:434 length:270 start_codon:yes stop_codon:yes gene_type:complete